MQLLRQVSVPCVPTCGMQTVCSAKVHLARAGNQAWIELLIFGNILDFFFGQKIVIATRDIACLNGKGGSVNVGIVMGGATSPWNKRKKNQNGCGNISAKS